MTPVPLKKILFLSFDHIGDILRFTPVFRSLKINYPDSFLVGVFPEAQGKILKYNPHLDQLILFPQAEIRKSLKEWANINQIVHDYGYSFISALRRTQFDLVINPFGDFEAIIAGLIKPKRVLGRIMTGWGEFKIFGENAAKFYYSMAKTNEIRVYAQRLFSDSALTLLEDLELDPNSFSRKPELHISEKEREFASLFFKENGIVKNDYVVGFQMGALLDERRFWSFKRFAKLAKNLNNRGTKVMVFGTKTDEAIIKDELFPHLKTPVINAAGKTNLLELGGLLEKLDLLVSVDTGPMHMAASLNVPIVALFGKTTCIPNEARPFGENHTILIGKDTRDIPFEEVMEATATYLEKSPKLKKHQKV